MYRQPRVLEELTYGSVPEGFMQTFPEKGSAPPLQAGWVYRVEVTPAGGIAKVSGIGRFLGPRELDKGPQ